MESSSQKLAVIMCITALLLTVVYLSIYLLVRQHRLSVEYVGSAMLFNSDDQAQQWLSEFQAERDTTPLLYSDSIPLYLLFWPAIQIDSVVSGRSIDSPAGGVEPYVIPPSNRPSPPVPVTDSGSEQPPAGDAQQVTPEE